MTPDDGADSLAGDAVPSAAQPSSSHQGGTVTSRQVVAVALVAALLGGAVGALVTSRLQSRPEAPSAAPVVQVDDLGVDPVAAAVAVAAPSVVRLDVGGTSLVGDGNGSGVVVSRDGLIVTSLHVVAGATRITAVLADGRELPAELVETAPDLDLAVVSVNADDLLPITVAEGAGVVAGQMAVVLGAPFGLDATVTAGVISAVARPIDLRGLDGSVLRLPRVLQTDAEINPGNSGGALVDRRGHLLGIASATLSQGRASGSGIGFAIPADLMAQGLEAVADDGLAPRARLGLAARTVGEADADDLGLSPDLLAGGGALVSRVDPDGPADVAGLRVDDVVVAVDGLDVSGVAALIGLVQAAGPGAEVTLDVLAEDGGRRQVVVLLADDGT